MTRAENDAEDAPNDGSGQRDERRAFDGMAEVRKKLFHDCPRPAAYSGSFKNLSTSFPTYWLNLLVSSTSCQVSPRSFHFSSFPVSRRTTTKEGQGSLYCSRHDRFSG